MTARAGHPHRRWRLSNKKAHLDHVRNDINVTPLVDVMLVLLIIFMLMTLLMGRGHDVNLAQATNMSKKKDMLQPVVSVDVDGDLWFEKDKLGPVGPPTLKEMNDRLTAAWAVVKNPEAAQRIYLKVGDMVDYGKVYPVLEYLNRTMVPPVELIDIGVAEAKAK